MQSSHCQLKTNIIEFNHFFVVPDNESGNYRLTNRDG